MHTQQIPKKLAPFFWHFIKKQWKIVAAIQLFSFAWSIDHTFWPYIIMLLIDAITNFAGDKANIWAQIATPLWMGAFLWIGLEISFRMAGLLLAKALPRLEADIRMSMFDYVQRHSHSYFSNNFAGTIANKISDMTQSFSHILQLVIQLFVPVALAICISTFLFYRVNPYFALILSTWLCLQIAISLFYSRKCAHYSDLHAEARSTLAGKIVDVLTNVSNVRLFSRHRHEYNYLSRYQEEEKSKHISSLWYIEKMKFAMGIVTFLGAGVATNWYMIYSWQQNMLTTGEVVFIFNTTWNMNMMAWIATLELPTLYKEIGVCKQALSIVRNTHDIVDDSNAKPLKVTRGEIVFDDVTFHYLPAHDIFQNKNITINAGEKVGLVGFSGSGKSTFVHLILRYFDVEEGRILIDGQDISKVTQDSLREQIAFIPQDASLFHRSLIENIQYGKLNSSDSEILEASKQAHCDEFVERMPEGYQALVGERGVKLSGGQRQRIAIARALLKNAPILILDEATSALDSVTERMIQDSLKELMEGRTSIVIAHRLSTLSDMDRILVFHEGQIIEEGSHEELLDAEGHYAEMWRMQAGGFLPDTSFTSQEA